MWFCSKLPLDMQAAFLSLAINFKAGFRQQLLSSLFTFSFKFMKAETKIFLFQYHHFIGLFLCRMPMVLLLYGLSAGEEAPSEK